MCFKQIMTIKIKQYWKNLSIMVIKEQYTTKKKLPNKRALKKLTSYIKNIDVKNLIVCPKY